jgi:hypothetical protein
MFLTAPHRHNILLVDIVNVKCNTAFVCAAATDEGNHGRGRRHRVHEFACTKVAGVLIFGCCEKNRLRVSL